MIFVWNDFLSFELLFDFLLIVFFQNYVSWYLHLSIEWDHHETNSGLLTIDILFYNKNKTSSCITNWAWTHLKFLAQNRTLLSNSIQENILSSLSVPSLDSNTSRFACQINNLCTSTEFLQTLNSSLFFLKTISTSISRNSLK